MNVPKYAQIVYDKIIGSGYEAFFVGGCVRDALMGREPSDYDITTNAKPAEIKALFNEADILPIGEKHGTIGIKSEGNVVEVTTYRVDGEYEDNRRPKEVTFTANIEEDLARRDFTINAIGIGRRFADPFGGREDIERKLIRCVGDPDRRFAEDALRILRALRFASVLDFEIEEKTAESAVRNRRLLKNISAERIFSEFKKLICGRGAERVLLKYYEIISTFVPEVIDSVGFDQKNRYHIYDVYTHIVKAVASCKQDETVRLALFFHDIGKPYCFTEDEKGGHFYSHAKKSSEIAEATLSRLKSSSAMKKAVTELVSDHDRIINADKKSVRRVLMKTSPEYFDMLMEVKRGDALAHAPAFRDGAAYVDALLKLKEEILKDEDCFSQKDLKINGNDIKALGLRGKEIGDMIKKLLDAVIEGTCENEREALLRLARSCI